MCNQTIDKSIHSCSPQIIREHYYAIGLEYCCAAWRYLVTEVDEDILDQEIQDACFGC